MIYILIFCIGLLCGIVIMMLFTSPPSVTKKAEDAVKDLLKKKNLNVK